MKKTIATFVLAAIAATMWAVPAKRGIWKTVSLADGSQVRVELVGDEFGSFWRAADGTAYRKADGAAHFERADVQAIAKAAQKLRAARKLRAPRRAPERTVGVAGDYTGQKKGLIILAQFSDKSFEPAHTQQMYYQMANGENYTNNMGVRGSVRDYFIAQSEGVFELDFDVIGPVTLAHEQHYYGKDQNGQQDIHAQEMIKEACQLADPEVNYADYDWDGDGEAEQVYVLYAGAGQASSEDADVVWPHEYQLQYAGINLKLDGIKINTYACGNEVNEIGGNLLEGIGTICHEFSHCLGLPDMYDTSYSGNFGMGPWSVMCNGCDLDSGHRPCGYNAYERIFCGWRTPEEITGETDIDSLGAISQGGGIYVMYNKRWHNEYYLVENRQQTGWDDMLYGNGLMITHVDYNNSVWAYNEVNTTDGYFNKTHQRCTIFHADNKDGFSTLADLQGDLYPYGGNNSLTAHSAPANDLWNNNSDGTKRIHLSIIGIARNGDGTMAFKVRTNESLEPTAPEGSLFYESFSFNYATGGNDGLWTATGTAALAPDNEGWSTMNAFAGFQCARFGTNRTAGNAITPAMTITEPCQLTFRAASCNGEATKLTAKVYSGEATIDTTDFQLASKQWTDFATNITGTGQVKIAIKANRGRFYIDEVTLTPLSANAITTVAADKAAKDNRIFTLGGQYAGTDKTALRKGIYVKGGKKIVVE